MNWWAVAIIAGLFVSSAAMLAATDDLLDWALEAPDVGSTTEV
jgi:hypothetical protein